jgi:hypothetical protein
MKFAYQCAIVLILSFLIVSQCGEDFFHQAPDQFKLSPGWQEPGFWRPKFIMDRVYTDADGNVEKTDRITFKLKPDRTMKIFQSKGRPFLEIFKKSQGGEREEKKRNLFEGGTEEMTSFEKQMKERETDENYFGIDGTWWWQDSAPLAQGKVKLETREGKGEQQEKIRHDVRCDWGQLDSYVPKFREGKLLKYKVEAGIPVGTYPAGTFTIKVSPHRPLVSKEYLAYQ